MCSYTSYSATAAVIAGWSVAAVVAESALLTSIYRQYPALASKPVEAGAAARGLVASVTASWRGWGCYWRHRVRGAGLGLALLYMTVLGFDSITWSYALLQVSLATPLYQSWKRTFVVKFAVSQSQ